MRRSKPWMYPGTWRKLILKRCRIRGERNAWTGSGVPSKADGITAHRESDSNDHRGQAGQGIKSSEDAGQLLRLVTILIMVGAIGFEPTTPYTPCRCAPKLRHAPTGANIAQEARHFKNG